MRGYIKVAPPCLVVPKLQSYPELASDSLAREMYHGRRPDEATPAKMVVTRMEGMLAESFPQMLSVCSR